MEFSTRLYLGKTVQDKKEVIEKKLKNYEAVPFVHVITLPLFEDGILEIYPAMTLIQKYYQDKEIVITGIASSAKEARTLVNQMVQDCYQTLGTFDMKNFFI